MLKSIVRFLAILGALSLIGFIIVMVVVIGANARAATIARAIRRDSRSSPN